MPLDFIDKAKQKNDADFKLIDLSDVDVDSASQTIASGAITQNASAVWLILDTESSAASDDLDTITRDTKGPKMLFISPANDARTIVIKHNTGNIKCANNADITLDDAHDFAILIYNGTSWFAQQGVKGDTGATGSTGSAGAAGADAVVKSTSTSSVAIGTGSKSFTTAVAMTLGVGSYIFIAETANPTTNWMFGQISSIGGTSITVNVTLTAGSGTIAAWTLTVAGTRGADGATGSTGSAGAAGRDAGIKYTYSNDTANSDPGSGKVKFNSTTLSSINTLRISETDGDSNAIAAFLATLDDSTSTVKATVMMVKDGAPGNILVLQITGTITDNGAWDQFSVTYVTSAGSFANNDVVKMFFFRNGDKGDTGAKPAGQLFLTAAGMWPSTTAGAQANTKLELATNKVNLYHLAFDATTAEYAEAFIAMPSDWDGGVVTAKFYWIHPATSTNFGVVWSIAGRSYGDNEALDAAAGTAVTVADTGGTTNNLYISAATGNVTLTGAAASELVRFRINRLPTDGSDTMAVDAFLLGVMISYTRT